MTMRRRKLPALALASIIAFQPLSALACAIPEGVEVSQTDAARMDDFLGSRSQGLGEALMSTSATDRALVSSLFDRRDGTIDAMPDGDYRCRTIKLGGLLPLTAYGYFHCAISENGTRIEKTTGSQRFSGSLDTTSGAVFYRGALHYGDEQPIAYGADAERDQVGCIYRVGDETSGRYRLELPAPQFESTHDVIELVPAR